MRGPLLSGPIGSAATLARVCQVVREHAPVAVLSALWLAEALSAEIPVTVLVEGERVRAARKAARKAADERRPLRIAAAGELLPLAPGAAGALIVEGLSEIEDDGEAADFLAGLSAALRPGGLLVALDATKSLEVEARLAGRFVAAALVRVEQERPKDGALLTAGAAGPPAVVQARLAGVAASE